MNKLFHTPMTHNAGQSSRCWQFLVSIRTYADFETVRNDLGNSLLTLLLSLCLFDSVRVSSLKLFARNIVKSWLSQRPDDEWNLKKSDPALSCVSSRQSFRVRIVFREMDVLRLLVISRWRGRNSEVSNGYELRTQLADKLTLEADARLVTSRISRMVLTVNWAGKCYSTPTNSPRVPRNSRGEIARGEG